MRKRGSMRLDFTWTVFFFIVFFFFFKFARKYCVFLIIIECFALKIRTQNDAMNAKGMSIY